MGRVVIIVEQGADTDAWLVPFRHGVPGADLARMSCPESLKGWLHRRHDSGPVRAAVVPSPLGEHAWRDLVACWRGNHQAPEELLVRVRCACNLCPPSPYEPWNDRIGTPGYVERVIDKALTAEDWSGMMADFEALSRGRAAIGAPMSSEPPILLYLVLANDLPRANLLVEQLDRYLAATTPLDRGHRMHVLLALRETLGNAIYHGNLEVSSALRDGDEKCYHRLADRRRREEPYRDRRVFLTASMASHGAVFVVRDEGPGFDPLKVPDPRDPSNICRLGGRGLLLIRSFMDLVAYSPTGNQVTLAKRWSSATRSA